jgi:hypothetical protein
MCREIVSGLLRAVNLVVFEFSAKLDRAMMQQAE